MFSIIIPTFNNLEYLKLCIESIKKNSKFNHQIITHINVGEDGTKDYLQDLLGMIGNLRKKRLDLLYHIFILKLLIP